MPHKLFVLPVLLFLSACVTPQVAEICPRVVIPRETAYQTQIVNYKEQFQISLVGYNGFCYKDERVNRTKAVIEPVFLIRRVRPGDENAVSFAYFTETVKGPPAYLGKKTYYADVYIPADREEMEYTAPQVEVKVPEGMKYDFDINLGLVLSPEELKYNRRTFDINYRMD